MEQMLVANYPLARTRYPDVGSDLGSYVDFGSSENLSDNTKEMLEAFRNQYEQEGDTSDEAEKEKPVSCVKYTVIAHKNNILKETEESSQEETPKSEPPKEEILEEKPSAEEPPKEESLGEEALPKAEITKETPLEEKENDLAPEPPVPKPKPKSTTRRRRAANTMQDSQLPLG